MARKFIAGSSLRNVSLSFEERGINVKIFQARIIRFKVDDFLLANKWRKRLEIIDRLSIIAENNRKRRIRKIIFQTGH